MKNKLIEVLSVQAVSYDQWRMFAYLIRQVYEYDFYVKNGNIYIEKGDALQKPCIVAHMDTVHDIVEDLSVIDIDGKLTGFNKVKMTQTGIGGDDKVGIFIALQCLNHFDNIKVAFFRDEEVGCVGSDLADMSFFDNCTFVLQCDRKGNKDFITDASGTELSSSIFQKTIKKTIKKYGYSFADGMITDVMTLKQNGLKVSCANISCGYYNPHCKSEYVVVDDVMNCLYMVIDIMSSFGSEEFAHEYAPKYINTRWDWSASYDNRKWDYRWDDSATPESINWKDEWGFDEKTKDSHSIQVDCCPACCKTGVLTYNHYYDSHLCEDCISTYCL